MSLHKVYLGVAAVIVFSLFSAVTPAYAASTVGYIDSEETAFDDPYVGFLIGSTGQSRHVAEADSFDTNRTVATGMQQNNFIGKVTAHWPHKSGSQASGHVTWELIWGSSPKLRTTSELWSYRNGHWVKRASVTASVWPSNMRGASGRGRAAVARAYCQGTKSTQWFTVGKLYAPGSIKPYGTHRSAVRSLNCG